MFFLSPTPFRVKLWIWKQLHLSKSKGTTTTWPYYAVDKYKITTDRTRYKHKFVRILCDELILWHSSLVFFFFATCEVHLWACHALKTLDKHKRITDWLAWVAWVCIYYIIIGVFERLPSPNRRVNIAFSVNDLLHFVRMLLWSPFQYV